jgi:hypothetical protein
LPAVHHSTTVDLTCYLSCLRLSETPDLLIMDAQNYY